MKSDFISILAKYRNISSSEKDKGERFERLMQAFLRTTPMYSGMFANIWLWGDFPFRDQFGGKDTGIDIVTRTHEGEYWAVQCKCYAETAYIDKPAVDSFLATSSKSFHDEQGKAVFSQRLWISTTNRWGTEAENTIKNQEPPVTRLNLSDLENAPVDWTALEQGMEGEAARTEKKTLRPHQTEALERFQEHFQAGGTRGKLIMACGTGKTFTSLKLAEQETGGKGLVLFLAPSIALVGQTLREWTAEAASPIHPICVCSDPKVSSRRVKNDDDSGYSVTDLALPATTHVPKIVQQLRMGELAEGMTVVFSTYQSIAVIEEAAKQAEKVFDLVICDEAHRTTGVTLKGEEAKPFVRVHDADFPAKRRVYMTATPRLYADETKQKAKDAEALLCSMDDEEMYGPEVFRIGFGAAVDHGLLSDYKVLVLTLSERQIPASLQAAVADKGTEINTDDAAKLIGCINALSKKMLVDEGLLKVSDPEPMRKAVAFCQSIKDSKKITSVFNGFRDSYRQSLPESERESIVSVAADHVDGTMAATIRDGKLSWLNDVSVEQNECRILTNVKCLSEGVDVPSLDAVLFLSARNSPIDVVQSVGRVMRKAPGKKFGYIIIPVLIPFNVKPEDALNDNIRFSVVWTVLNALRAHDDRFSAMINKIDLNKAGSTGGGSVLVGGIVDGMSENEEKTGAIQLTLPLEMQELHGAIYARMVQKVGERRYWEQWAADVAKIAQNYIERITRLTEQEGPHRQAFDAFLADLRKNINPSVTAAEVVEMLAQHVITKPVFEALFENYSFVQGNPVSRSLQKLLDLLEEQALDKDTEHLTRFYESVKNRAKAFKNAEDRQKAILELYDKFFRTAFPKTVEKLGIVYTPVEIVDFIINSADFVLQHEFGKRLADRNVHILDPFTGTGTFIARLIQSGLIPKEVLASKYQKELHANEIVLLAYYIASINIENSYHDTMGDETEFVPFPGICLTDTFQLGEADYMPTPSLPQNSERVKKQRDAPIQVIIGNPPYSVGQRSANDNAQNQSYPILEDRIAKTYAAASTATLKNSLYDSYIKAFRWASDRLKGSGVIAFVTNAGWLDGNAMDGMRKCLLNEFNKIYIFNLRGGIRGKKGDTAKKEGDNVFNIMTQVAITVLVKIPGERRTAKIYYHDIGEYLKREKKLQTMVDNVSIGCMDWLEIQPNEHGDWITQRNSVFESFIPIGDKKNKSNQHTFFINLYSIGLKTNRDVWCYNNSSEVLHSNITRMIEYYNNILDKHLISTEGDFDIDPQCISWSDALHSLYNRGVSIKFNGTQFRTTLYRPFFKTFLYYDKILNERLGKIPNIFPDIKHYNIVICIDSGKNGFPLISNIIPDFHINGDSQCFPLYYYDECKRQGKLFDKSVVEYDRKDGLTDFILSECCNRYGRDVTKEDIFYYVYSLLHSSEYRETFAADLTKMLPRLPLMERADDFWAFSQAGRELAKLHLDYESQPPCPDVTVTGTEREDFTVQKMRFVTKGDKSAIQYNPHIRLTNIPLTAYDYVVNGRSAIEWIMERYQVKTDKASGIVNDPNDWSREHDQPRYILDLLLSIVTVSLETMKIVRALPKIEFNNL